MEKKNLNIEELVKNNQDLVAKVAEQYQGKGLSLEELVEKGNIGLVKAAQKFDETRDCKFSSFAVWWVRQEMLQAICEKTPAQE